MKTIIRRLCESRRSFAVCLTASSLIAADIYAAPITSLVVTSGEFRMGPFTPTGPVPFSYTGPYDLMVDFPTPIGWDVNVGQNIQDGVQAQPTSVVSFLFGDPWVNTFNVECDPQVVDGCDVNPHTAPSGTVGGGSATIADGDPIIFDINGLYANWNGIDFNQGGTSGDGVAYPGETWEFAYTSRVSNVVGNTFDYNMTWQSLIVGGPFNGQIGTWTFIGSGTVALVGNPPKTDPGLTLAPNNFTEIAGLTPLDLTLAGFPLPGAEQDCIGGCWDWIVTGLAAAGDSANVVIPLGSGIPSPATSDQAILVWKLDTATSTWIPFDTSAGDQFSTSQLAGTVCPDPADAAYTPGLTPGDSCLQLTVADGGPNDDDGTLNQQITDPGSLVLTTAPRTLTPISQNDGCTLASTPRDPWKRAEWLLIAGFLVWLRIVVRRRQY